MATPQATGPVPVPGEAEVEEGNVRTRDKEKYTQTWFIYTGKSIAWVQMIFFTTLTLCLLQRMTQGKYLKSRMDESNSYGYDRPTDFDLWDYCSQYIHLFVPALPTYEVTQIWIEKNPLHFTIIFIILSNFLLGIFTGFNLLKAAVKENSTHLTSWFVFAMYSIMKFVLLDLCLAFAFMYDVPGSSSLLAIFVFYTGFTIWALRTVSHLNHELDKMYPRPSKIYHDDDSIESEEVKGEHSANV